MKKRSVILCAVLGAAAGLPTVAGAFPYDSVVVPDAKTGEVALVQNCANGPHVLELRPRKPDAGLGFSHFNVYRPGSAGR